MKFPEIIKNIWRKILIFLFCISITSCNKSEIIIYKQSDFFIESPEGQQHVARLMSDFSKEAGLNFSSTSYDFQDGGIRYSYRSTSREISALAGSAFEPCRVKGKSVLSSRHFHVVILQLPKETHGISLEYALKLLQKMADDRGLIVQDKQSDCQV